MTPSDSLAGTSGSPAGAAHGGAAPTGTGGPTDAVADLIVGGGAGPEQGAGTSTGISTGTSTGTAAPADPPTERSEEDVVHDAVLDCPAVLGLSEGVYGEVRSYLRGRTVPGVRLRDDTVEVHVVVAYGTALQEVGDQVGTALTPYLKGRELHVVVADVALAAPAR